MARPRPIIVSATLYFLYGLIELLHGFLIREQVPLEDLRFFVGEWALVVWLVIRFAAVVFIFWLTYFKKSSIGRILAVLQFAPLAYRLPTLPAGLATGNLKAIVWMAGFVAGAVALAFLFTRDSRYFFATKGGSTKGDAAAFD